MFVVLLIGLHPTQELEPPENPGRFKPQEREEVGGGRPLVHDAAMGAKAPQSTVLTAEEEVMAVVFRRHTLLPLDERLYAFQASIPHPTRSSLHRPFQRHDISRLPTIEGDKVGRKTFKVYLIDYVHVDIAGVCT